MTVSAFLEMVLKITDMADYGGCCLCGENDKFRGCDHCGKNDGIWLWLLF